MALPGLLGPRRERRRPLGGGDPKPGGRVDRDLLALPVRPNHRPRAARRRRAWRPVARRVRNRGWRGRFRVVRPEDDPSRYDVHGTVLRLERSMLVPEFSWDESVDERDFEMSEGFCGARIG